MKNLISGIATVIVVALAVCFVVKSPDIKEKKLRRECERYQTEYFSLLENYTPKSEEFLLKSHEIYRGLCDILTEASADMKYESVGKEAYHILLDIFGVQAYTVRCMDDILMEKKYIDDILTPELAALEKVSEQYEKEMMKEVKRIL